MGQYKIIGEFNDIHTGQKYMPGDLAEFTKERAKAILKVGELIELVPESPDRTEEGTEKVK